MINKKLVFSGVQPTGNLHLGNYLGALKNFTSLQKEMPCIYCVVDLHAITTFQKPSQLQDNVLETAASFLAYSGGLQVVRTIDTATHVNAVGPSGAAALIKNRQ